MRRLRCALTPRCLIAARDSEGMAERLRLPPHVGEEAVAAGTSTCVAETWDAWVPDAATDGEALGTAGEDGLLTAEEAGDAMVDDFAVGTEAGFPAPTTSLVSVSGSASEDTWPPGKTYVTPGL